MTTGPCPAHGLAEEGRDVGRRDRDAEIEEGPVLAPCEAPTSMCWWRVENSRSTIQSGSRDDRAGDLLAAQDRARGLRCVWRRRRRIWSKPRSVRLRPRVLEERQHLGRRQRWLAPAQVHGVEVVRRLRRRELAPRLDRAHQPEQCGVALAFRDLVVEREAWRLDRDASLEVAAPGLRQHDQRLNARIDEPFVLRPARVQGGRHNGLLIDRCRDGAAALDLAHALAAPRQHRRQVRLPGHVEVQLAGAGLHPRTSERAERGFHGAEEVGLVVVDDGDAGGFTGDIADVAASVQMAFDRGHVLGDLPGVGHRHLAQLAQQHDAPVPGRDRLQGEVAVGAGGYHVSACHVTTAGRARRRP